MAFPDSFLQELAERNRIEDVVGEYVRLTKRSGSNIFGLCPFHSEKTPSFSVAPDKQIYHCFGCGKGGSVINFIMEIENLSFRDAVYFLARRAGMTVPEDKPDERGQQRERMLKLNRDAARFFYSRLEAPGGAPAREYIIKRGISGAMAKNFGLGYAPDEWYALSNAMRDKGYSEQELISAGLVIQNKSGRGVHDRFRGRLMFPVIDVRGSVIGFSGRILGDGEPKYMNSPETLVFSKSHNLFGLNLAKKSKNGYIILAEGNIDVVSLHQAGFDSAVASLGTSLTAEQARLISRYTSEVIIAYDNDEAGRKASQRAIGILEKLDIKVRVLRMSGAKDPDEFIKANGPEAFAKLITASENHIDYRLGQAASKYDLSQNEDKVSYLREAVSVLSELPGAVEREVYAGRVAEQTGLSKSAVLDELKRARARRVSRDKQQRERDQTRPLRAVQPKSRELKYDNPASAAAERGVIALVSDDPGLFALPISPKKEDFSSEFLGRLYEELKQLASGGLSASPAALAAKFSPDELAVYTEILSMPEIAAPMREKALSDYIETMKSQKIKSAGSVDLRAVAEQKRRVMVDRYGNN